MSAGFAVSKADFDNAMGKLVISLRQDLSNVVEFKKLLDDTDLYPDSVLTSMGYSSTDISNIRTTFADLKKLSDIANGQDQQVGNNNFFFTAKKLTGISTV